MSGSSRLTRRRLLVGAAGVAAGGAAVGIAVERSGGGAKALPPVPLGGQPAGLPLRQHAWGDYLATDADGNAISPRFDRLLFFDVARPATSAYARVLEAALRTLERAFPWRHTGLLFTASWSPDYFERVLRVPSSIPRAKGMSDFENPSIDTYDMCLHLACDDEQRLASIEGALLHGEPLAGASGWLEVASALTWRETRTGFAGTGLPARYQHTGGIPSGNPVPKDSPLFMGFKSGFKKNQASEDYATIANGPFAGGTTMHVSYMRLRLDSWYQNLDERERVALMYAPQITPGEVKRFTTDGGGDPKLLNQAVNHYGVIGHAQSSAQARTRGHPRIIRRDFNTVDGGQAGVHFVSVQSSIEEFVKTRNAMNSASAQLQNPAITDTDNNGINAFIFVLKRANYIVPTRPNRSFPLLPGRDRGLG